MCLYLNVRKIVTIPGSIKNNLIQINQNNAPILSHNILPYLYGDHFLPQDIIKNFITTLEEKEEGGEPVLYSLLWGSQPNEAIRKETMPINKIILTKAEGMSLHSNINARDKFTFSFNPNNGKSIWDNKSNDTQYGSYLGVLTLNREGDDSKNAKGDSGHPLLVCYGKLENKCRLVGISHGRVSDFPSYHIYTTPLAEGFIDYINPDYYFNETGESGNGASVSLKTIKQNLTIIKAYVKEGSVSCTGLFLNSSKLLTAGYCLEKLEQYKAEEIKFTLPNQKEPITIPKNQMTFNIHKNGEWINFPVGYLDYPSYDYGFIEFKFPIESIKNNLIQIDNGNAPILSHNILPYLYGDAFHPQHRIKNFITTLDKNEKYGEPTLYSLLWGSQANEAIRIETMPINKIILTKAEDMSLHSNINAQDKFTFSFNQNNGKSIWDNKLNDKRYGSYLGALTLNREGDDSTNANGDSGHPLLVCYGKVAKNCRLVGISDGRVYGYPSYHIYTTPLAESFINYINPDY